MTILITGGAGFIGSNLASHFLQKGERVIVFDNLYRKGVGANLEWLKSTYGNDCLEYVNGDVRNPVDVMRVAPNADVIYHLAAQVAVTTSVTDPRPDFEINALGSFNVLEAARLSGRNPILIYTSTNKVYGGMEDVEIVEQGDRYIYRDYPQGISEDRPLDFHSPYGCSKGTADQYVRDYSRIYGLRSVVFRMSCIYGPRQFGNEDQGWVAYFVIASMLGWPISIFGDGKQVRDILFVEDLVRAFDLATQNIATTAGQVYNIGGGAGNTLAIWTEFGTILSDIVGHPVPVTYGDWRPGDQLVYVSNPAKAERDFGWKPEIGKLEGIQRLSSWVRENIHLFQP